MVKDQNQLKATVIEKNNPLYANPSIQSPSLTELKEGELVIVKDFYENWIKIRSSDGLPGWVPRENLYLFGKSQKN